MLTKRISMPLIRRGEVIIIVVWQALNACAMVSTAFEVCMIRRATAMMVLPCIISVADPNLWRSLRAIVIRKNRATIWGLTAMVHFRL